jgi:hypothetical protein
MADDPFGPQDPDFEPVSTPGGVLIAEREARYATILREVLADGVISAEDRARLSNVAEAFGLARERARQLEQALVAAHEAASATQVTEEDASGAPVPPPAADEPPENTDELAPLTPADNPAVRSLQNRILHLELHNEELLDRHNEAEQQVEQLENLVFQLQEALGSTLEELDQVHAELADNKQAPSAQPDAPLSVTQLRDESEAPIPEPRPSGTRVSRPPEPEAPSSSPPSQPPPRKKRRSRRPIPRSAAKELVLTQRRANPADLHRHYRSSPRDASLLQRLYASLGRAADGDRRWCIAQALVFLGEANDEQQALFERHSDSNLVKPKRAVNDDEWHELLFHPNQERLPGLILAEIAPAVLLGHITAVQRRAGPPLVDPDQRVEHADSTIQAVRCLSWAAQLLGLHVPATYVSPDHDHGVELVLDPQPATRIGQRALAGRSTHELAFLAGRHLSWYRRELVLGRVTGMVEQLEEVFLASLLIGNPGLPMADDVRERVEPLARSIRPLLSHHAHERLGAFFERFVEQGGRTNLVSWLDHARLTANCAGLLLCNDLAAAAQMLETEGEQGRETLVDELLVYSTADRYSLLRKRVGIAVA